MLELDSIRNALLQRAAQKQQALKAAKENGRQEPEKDDADNAVSKGACIQRQDTDRSLMEQHEEADEEQRRLSVELAGLNGVDYVEVSPACAPACFCVCIHVCVYVSVYLSVCMCA